MDDPMGRVRESDRRAAIRRVQDACRDGLIVEADRDFRVEQLRAARSLTDLDLVTRDLEQRSAPPPPTYQPYQPPASPADQSTEQTIGQSPAPAYRPYRPRRHHAPTTTPQAPKNRQPPNKGKSMAGAVALFLLIVGFATVFREDPEESGVDGQTEQYEMPAIPEVPDVPDIEAYPDPLTPSGFHVMRRLLEDETGSTVVLEATLYPRYALLTAPADGANGSRKYRYDRLGIHRAGSAAGGTRLVDLARIDQTTARGLVRKARALVDDPTQRYLIIRREGGDPGVLRAYASNDARETGYLVATVDGRVVRSVP